MSETIVTIDLEDVSDGTLMVLTHEGLKNEEVFNAHKHGWETSVEDFGKILLYKRK